MFLNLILSVFLIWYICYSISFMAYLNKKQNKYGAAGYFVLAAGSVIMVAVKFIFM